MDCGLAPAAPDEDIVYGARRPGAGGPGTPNATVDDWVETVRNAGVRRVLCLLSDRQLARYDDLLGRLGAAFGEGAVAHVPIPDHTFVDGATLGDEVLPVLRDADAAGEPIVVHCWAGIGRTGHVLALWLASERGYDLDAAVDAVRATGRRPLEAARGSDIDGRMALRRLLNAESV
jgi:protein-tyrosine phosphatase